MKNSINLIWLCATLFLVSCSSNLLEPVTPGNLDEETVFRSSEQVKQLMNSTYSLFTNRADVVLTSIITDECGIGFANSGQGLAATGGEFEFFLNPTSPRVAGIWNSCYLALSRVNRVIAIADKLIAKTDPANLDELKQLNTQKAQALTLRAMCNLKIMAFFSPDLKDDNALAGPLYTTVVKDGDELKERATNGAFYAQIHKDLDDAVNTFSNKGNNVEFFRPDAKCYASIPLAFSLRARAYLYKGDYVNAEKFALSAFNTATGGFFGLKLADATNYAQVFKDIEPNNVEVIFKLKRTLQDRNEIENLGNGYDNFNGTSFFEVGRSLYNKLAANPDDVRTNVVVFPEGPDGSTIDKEYQTSKDYRNSDRLLLGKHTGTDEKGIFNPDFKIVRLMEMFFIIMEAQVGQNNLAGAATVMRAYLSRRFPAGKVPVLANYANAAEAWKDILDQRRLEFAFEGHRYIDLKRIGKLAGIDRVDRDPADYNSSTANYPNANPKGMLIDSYKFTLPIPQTERNVNLKIQQNLGY